MTRKGRPRGSGIRIVHRQGFHITVALERDPTGRGPSSGTISSNLKCGGRPAIDRLYNAAIDGLESLILAHACAGVDIESEAYVEGVETAVEAISNNLS